MCRSFSFSDVLKKAGRRLVAPLSSIAAAVLKRAGGWRCGIIRVGAERAQSALGVRDAEHGKRSRLMLAVERRRLGRVEVAAG